MKEELDQSLETLRAGGTLLYPTDTVWGLGCDATNTEAVEKLFQLKQREAGKSMLVLIPNDAWIERYVKQVPEVAWDLIDASERPLTIIYPGATGLANNLLAEDGSIGIRIVKDGFVNKLLQRFGKPLVSTSANISGHPTPLSREAIEPAILDGVDHLVNLPALEQAGQPSSIIKLEVNGEFRIIRK